MLRRTMSKRWMRSLAAVILVAGIVAPVLATHVQTFYWGPTEATCAPSANWRINDPDNNWDQTVAPWFPERDADHYAIINDTSCHLGLVVVNIAQGFNVGLLFLGDGHTMELEVSGSFVQEVVTQEGVVTHPGELEFDGVVKFKGMGDEDRTILCKYITVNTTQRTTVKFVDLGNAGSVIAD